MLHQIQIEFNNPEDVRELLSLAEQYEDITAIEEKSFTGDVTRIELHVSGAINILTIVGAALNALIAKKKVSSVKIDGDKIELNNVSEDLIKRIVERKLGLDVQDKPDADRYPKVIKWKNPGIRGFRGFV